MKRNPIPVLLLLFLAAIPAIAQSPGSSQSRATTPAPAEVTATESGRRISSPGAMLDDYETAEPGTVSFTVGGGYWKVSAGRDISLPATTIQFGLTRWLEVQASSSLARTQFEEFRTTAMGDAYISAKVALLHEGKHRPGIAFEPMLEVLGRPSLADNALAPKKYNAAFGGIIGKNIADTVRLYNHSGFFTRGIAFSSTALEITRFSRVTPVVYMTLGALTANRQTAADLQLNASRPDVGGSLGIRISKNWSSYVSVARSLGRRDLNSVDIAVSGGVTYTWRPFAE